ncbi:MAG: phosphatase PAP2 family protein, partial [Candidatus Kariarchaeaceae archaeon]
NDDTTPQVSTQVPHKDGGESLLLKPVSSVNLWKFSVTESQMPGFLRLIGLFLAASYVSVLYLLEGFNIMHYFFAFIIFFLFAGGSKDFIKFWAPFVVLWISYDANHIITKNLKTPVHVKDIYDMELAVTGWFTNGEVLPFIFQKYRTEHADDALVVILDIITALFYGSHLIAPIVFGILIYKKFRTNIEFNRFVFTFIGVSYAGLITFLLFPAAPPWYVWNNGGVRNHTIPSRENTVKDAGGLTAVDDMIGFPLFEKGYESLNSNAYAAIPSIHNAYAIIISIYAIRIYMRKAYFMTIYPLGMAFSSMWLNHHYLIDILWSIGYITIFYLLAIKLFPARDPLDDSDSNFEN